MKINVIIFLTCVLTLNSFASFSQSVKQATYNQLVASADTMYARKDFEQSIELLKQAENFRHPDGKFFYMLALNMVGIGRPDKAKAYMKKSWEKFGYLPANDWLKSHLQ